MKSSNCFVWLTVHNPKIFNAQFKSSHLRGWQQKMLGHWRLMIKKRTVLITTPPCRPDFSPHHNYTYTYKMSIELFNSTCLLSVVCCKAKCSHGSPGHYLDLHRLCLALSPSGRLSFLVRTSTRYHSTPLPRHSSPAQVYFTSISLCCCILPSCPSFVNQLPVNLMPD